ncbi:MAG: hypothetical protein EA390_13755, partial [Balneolaceae bacterium]
VEFPITFEEDVEWDDFITNFDGGELTVVDNPDKSGINESDKVARMVKDDGQPWGGAFIELPESIDFSDGTDFTVSVWAPRANTTMLFKIENEEEPTQEFEQVLTIAESQEWVDITFNMAGADPSFTYEKLVFIFDIGTIGDGTDNFTWYFDNIRQAEPDDDNGDNGDNGEPGEQVNLPITFDDDNISYGIVDFGGTVSEIVEDPTDASNRVVETVKQDGEPWAGTSVGDPDGFVDPIPFTSSETTMSVRVWSPTAGIPVRLKVENADTPEQSVETEATTTVAEEWETLVFDFSNEAEGTAELNLSYDYNLASIFFDFNTPGNGETYYWDDVEFGGEAGNGNGGETGPTSAAPTPTKDADDVLSVFSDEYTDISDTNFNPDWGQATQVSFVEIDGNETMLYTGLNYQGIELGSNQDVSDYDYVHVDFWTANSTSLSIFVISPGNETPYELTVPTDGWSSVDIPLSAFVPPVDLADVFQFKFEGNGDVYIDNIYFWKDDNGNGGNGDDNGDATGLNQPIDFEEGGFGADWDWTVFENDSNPPLEIIDNPDKSEPNTSDTVARFTALETGGAFAGFETVEGQLGEFLFTNENCVVTVDVWKSVATDVSVKFDTGAPPNDWGTALVTVANTETEQWETLTFNFCAVSPEQQNPPSEFGGLKRIAIFPDNEERNQENVIFIDNITFSAE